jgi:hypothetical protein
MASAGARVYSGMGGTIIGLHEAPVKKGLPPSGNIEFLLGIADSAV